VELRREIQVLARQGGQRSPVTDTAINADRLRRRKRDVHTSDMVVIRLPARTHKRPRRSRGVSERETRHTSRASRCICSMLELSVHRCMLGVRWAGAAMRSSHG